MKLKVLKLNKDATLPTRGSKASSGLDLYALEDTTIPAGKTVLVKTGISFIIPEGYEIQVRPRSGMSLKTPLRVANTPGTVDQDYTGECSVIMHNTDDKGNSGYNIKKGDRIAQAVLAPVLLLDVVEVFQHEQGTDRGAAGFGSTGN